MADYSKPNPMLLEKLKTASDGEIAEYLKNAKAKLIGVAARGVLNRKDYGVGTGFKHTTMKNFLGDEISIEIYCWLRPRKEEEQGD